MTYRLNFMPQAIDELIVINQWIAEFAGPIIAGRKVAEIEASAYSLCDHPHRGNLQRDLGTGIRAIPVGDKAVITFQVDDINQVVLVLSVTYGGQDWQSRTRDRL